MNRIFRWRYVVAIVPAVWATFAPAAERDPRYDASVSKALEFLAREQRRQGYWEANGGQYRVAMTALAGIALSCEGSTTLRGRYSEHISKAVDYLLDVAQPNGLIGYQDDYHYTYGHGFSMLFLSQVFGEEEDNLRRQRLHEVLTKAVVFSVQAQTSKGGWGYVSARDGNDFDEGSTCVTQVQGLRACRNAGVVVPGEVIDSAKSYIHECMADNGGIEYSIRGGGDRPPITAAAVASMYSAGEYDGSEDVQKMLEYCRKKIWPGNEAGGQTQHFGHWHYMHLYYSQVMYRHEDDWPKYFRDIGQQLLRTQSANGSWTEGHVGPVYVTAICAIILQLDKASLPIYQK